MKLKVLVLLSCLALLPVGVAGQKKAKKIVVSGVVSDQTGRPLEAVNIFIDGKNTSVITDNQGRFRIKVKPDVSTISAFSLMYGTHEVIFEGQSSINFYLKGDIPGGVRSEENEGQVDIGYQSLDQGDETTSVKTVRVKDKSTKIYSDIYDMIKKELPGVIVNGKNIKLRGVSSILLSSQPLFVINGNPVNSVEGINPNEVESLSVLNGASASIYGSRGSNGVILIRMKGSERK